MSVPVQTPYKKYTAAPGATVFPTTFRVVLAGDLQVTVDAVVVTTGFTLSTLGLSAGVDVTFTTPMVGGEIVELQRIIPKSRVNDYQQLGNFDASVVNADIDRLWMSVQEVGEEISRAILVPIGSGTEPQDLIDQLIDSAATAVAAAGTATTQAGTATTEAAASAASAAAAAASVASAGLPALTGKTLNLLRVKADETGYETRTPAQAFSDIKQAASDTATGVVELATTTEMQTGTDTARVPSVSALRNGLIVLGTAVPATSGTAIDFTAIPAWVKRITVMFNGVSTNGTSLPIVQLGDSGGIETSGYNGCTTSVNFGGGTAPELSSSGFILSRGSGAAAALHGCLFLTLLNPATNTWSVNGNISHSGTAFGNFISGTKALSAALDRLRITTAGGVDTFDAGEINIAYE